MIETIKIKVYTKAPIWWTSKDWKMSSQEREKVGIKLIEIEYNINTSAQHLEIDDDIVRAIQINESIEAKDKEL